MGIVHHRVRELVKIDTRKKSKKWRLYCKSANGVWEEPHCYNHTIVHLLRLHVSPTRKNRK